MIANVEDVYPITEPTIIWS